MSELPLAEDVATARGVVRTTGSRLVGEGGARARRFGFARAAAVVAHRGVAGTALKRGVTAGVMLYAGGVALRTVSELLFARVMGPADYGAYAYVFAWASILAVGAGFGVPYTLFRFVPEYEVAGDRAALRRLARFARTTAASGGIAVGAVGGAAIYASHPRGVAPLALLIGAITVPALAVLTAQTELARGFRRMVLAYLPFQNLRPLLTVVAALAVFGVTGRLSASGVLSAGLVATCVCVVLQWPGVRRLLGSVAGQAGLRRGEMRTWMSVAYPLLIINLLAAVLSRADVIVVGSFRGAGAAGVYAAAAKVSLLATFALDALNTAVAPSLAQRHYAGDVEGLRRLVRGSARVTTAAALVATALLVAFGAPVLGLFGTSYREGAIALDILVLGQLINACTGPVVYLMAATGHHRLAARAQVVSVIAFVVVAVPLTEHFGIVGAAIGVSVARSLLNIWMAIAAKQRLAIRAFVW